MQHVHYAKKKICLSIPYRILTIYGTKVLVKGIYLSIPYRILTLDITVIILVALSTFNSLPDSHIRGATEWLFRIILSIPYRILTRYRAGGIHPLLSLSIPYRILTDMNRDVW